MLIEDFIPEVYRQKPPTPLEYKKKYGSKTAPIRTCGWLFPDGTFVSNGGRTHVMMAQKMGYGYGYDEAFTAGLLRVSFTAWGDEAYLETDKRMSPELEKIVLKAIKRFSKGYGLEFVSGSGTGYQKRFD